MFGDTNLCNLGNDKLINLPYNPIKDLARSQDQVPSRMQPMHFMEDILKESVSLMPAHQVCSCVTTGFCEVLQPDSLKWRILSQTTTEQSGKNEKF